jgi:hypothetical protein
VFHGDPPDEAGTSVPASFFFDDEQPVNLYNPDTICPDKMDIISRNAGKFDNMVYKNDRVWQHKNNKYLLESHI